MADGRYPNLILVTIGLRDLLIWRAFSCFLAFMVSLRRSAYPQPDLEVLFHLDTFPSCNYLYRFGHVDSTFVVISLCVTQPVVSLAVGLWFSLSCISVSLNFCQNKTFRFEHLQSVASLYLHSFEFGQLFCVQILWLIDPKAYPLVD